jgi:hypothetical protein|nr:MAG TPA: PGDYG protein [Caudoviricetes sp.]
MKFRKKPVVVEAVRFQPNEHETFSEIPCWLEEAFALGSVMWETKESLIISTLEGDHLVSTGDYIIRGIKGELYPCKPDIFNQTYEKVEE